MSVDRLRVDDEPIRQQARIDVLPIPPVEQIPTAVTTLIAKVASQLKRYQVIFSNERTDHPTSFAELQRMFAEIFPSVEMERPIDLDQTTQTTLDFTEAFWRARRDVHLKMAAATLGVHLTNNERGPAARDALLGKSQLLGSRSFHFDGIVDVRRKMDEKLKGVTIPDQLQHTLYVVRVTDGVLTSSQAERSAGRILNHAAIQKLNW